MRIACAALLVLGLASSAAAQQTYLLVVSGLGGTDEYRERFHDWAATLVDAAAERYGLPADRIVYLAETPDRDPVRIDGRSTWTNVRQAMTTLAERARPNDLVFMVLIGHGSFRNGNSRFNLPGPDPSAEDFATALESFRSQRVVFANTASASGGFVEALSGARRTIITATRTGRERNETRFGGFFIGALAGGEDGAAADTNKDGRISVLEAFNYARGTVARGYEQDGLLLTEHAMLDDNGDGEGTAEPDPVVASADGRAAQSIVLAPGGAPAPTEIETDNPELRALYARRRDLEARVEAHTQLKGGLAPDAYQQELEKLLLELATTNRAIHRLEEQRP